MSLDMHRNLGFHSACMTSQRFAVEKPLQKSTQQDAQFSHAFRTNFYIKQKGFVFRIENLYWNTSFRLRLGIFVKWCKTFCHVIKLMKYHVTKRPGRSPGARIQRRGSMSEPGNEFQ